jgi:hypothetical protein
MEVILGIIAVVGVGLIIREQFVNTKRTLHNSFRALKEVRPLEDIETEENVLRSFNGITKQYEKKQKGGGGFFKGVIVTLIVVALIVMIASM